MKPPPPKIPKDTKTPPVRPKPAEKQAIIPQKPNVTNPPSQQFVRPKVSQETSKEALYRPSKPTKLLEKQNLQEPHLQSSVRPKAPEKPKISPRSTSIEEPSTLQKLNAQKSDFQSSNQSKKAPEKPKISPRSTSIQQPNTSQKPKQQNEPGIIPHTEIPHIVNKEPKPRKYYNDSIQIQHTNKAPPPPRPQNPSQQLHPNKRNVSQASDHSPSSNDVKVLNHQQQHDSERDSAFTFQVCLTVCSIESILFCNSLELKSRTNCQGK